ncbi:M20/M25/M40 family metallo-hydrolase [Mucilaginibacter pedocola]|uniref:Carboxypeptidase Q n=1 Tax=Mucilaginibacter pedocola TaxID=1792845 RepID=A0A1S9PIW0_9SPHI|nr:M20/M25/M40 family metallo-hydrolase [Mucilaginibacter pedocola]OOQ60869.1 hypothetical protein BC343_23175 [Mucilaginibacter pedocola]
MKNFYKNLAAAACLLCSSPLLAQVDTAAFNKIRKAELSSSQIEQIAHYLTDVSGPRLTNSPGYKRAATWAIETMKKWGLTNAAMEPWGEFGKQWDLQDFSISMRVPYAQSIMAYPDPWSPSTNGPQQAQVALLPGEKMMDTVYLKQHLADYKGKFILVHGAKINTSSNFKPSAQRLSDTALANTKDTYMVSHAEIEQYTGFFKILARVDALLKSSGAIAIISTGRNNINGTVFVQANGGFKTTDPENLPRISISVEDGQKIRRLVSGGQPVELAVNIKATLSTEDTKGYNVVAEIPGTDPKLKSQLVMLGGHLDSWTAATGATDNAAGCIVMMEAVRLLDSLGLKPKRTIRIALWGGEEQGVYGSYGYVKNHFMGTDFKLKPEQAKVSVYFNLDNGTGKIRGIYTQGNTAVKPMFEQWFAPFKDLGASTVANKNTGSTDHLSFDWAGIPGFQFIQDPIDYETRTHHSNMDSYDHLQIDDLKQAAIIVASFVYQASIKPEMLPRKPLAKEVFAFDGM